MAQVDAKRVKDIKINFGVVKRIAKEKQSYAKEAEQIEAKVEKMKTDGKDEYEVRKMEECLQESRMMVPDCHRRLGQAWQKLNALLESEKDLADTEEYKNALQIIEDTKEEAGQ